MRLVVLLSGFGAGWVLAEAFGASSGTALVVGASAAVVLGVVALLMTRFLFFIAGGCVGAVIGARLFVVLDGDAAAGHGSWLVGIVFVAAVALLCGFPPLTCAVASSCGARPSAGSALLLGGLGGSGRTPTGCGDRIPWRAAPCSRWPGWRSRWSDTRSRPAARRRTDGPRTTQVICEIPRTAKSRPNAVRRTTPSVWLCRTSQRVTRRRKARPASP